MKEKGNIIIYAIAHPLSKEIRYIGKSTQKDFKKRKISHKFEGLHNKYKTHKCKWLRGIFLNKLEPVYYIIEEIEYTENWYWLEKYWISQFKTWGFNLLNLTEGGDGNQHQIFTKESILVRNNKLKGKIRTEEQRKNISNGLKGIKLTPEHINNTRLGIIKLQGKPVAQYDLQNNLIAEYNCVVDAALALGNKNWHANIHKCCQKIPRYKTCAGFKWKYIKNQIKI